MQRLIPAASAIPMIERGLRVRFVPGSEPEQAAQQDRLRKCSLASVATHRTDAGNSSKMDNTMNSNSLKAQGKGLMHPVLTEVSLRNSGLLPVSQTPSLGVMMKPEVANGKETVQQGVQA